MAVPPRYWTRENLENFIDYFSHAQVQEDLRANAKTLKDAIDQGVIVDVNDVPDVAERRMFLREKLKTIVYGEMKKDKKNEKRMIAAKVESMSFQKGTLIEDHGAAAKDVEKSGRIFRTSTDIRSMNHAMDIFATVGKLLVPVNNDIAKKRVELAKKEREAENIVKTAFERLFHSINEGERDILVDPLTLINVIRKRNKLPPIQKTQNGSSGSSSSSDSTVGSPNATVENPKVIVERNTPLSPKPTAMKLSTPAMKRNVPATATATASDNNQSQASSQNDGENEEFTRFAGNFSLVGSQKFKGVKDPWPTPEHVNGQENPGQENPGQEKPGRKQAGTKQNEQENSRNLANKENQSQNCVAEGKGKSADASKGDQHENTPATSPVDELNIDLEMFKSILWDDNVQATQGELMKGESKEEDVVRPPVKRSRWE